MVSNASDDFPEPLSPVITTSRSRGMSSVRFFRLCSRAPPIRMRSIAIESELSYQSIPPNLLDRQTEWKCQRPPAKLEVPQNDRLKKRLLSQPLRQQNQP